MLRVAVIISVIGDTGSASDSLDAFRRQADAVAAGGKYSFSVFLNTEREEGLPAFREHTVGDGFDLLLLLDSTLRPQPGSLASLLETSEFLRHKAIIAGTVAAADGTLLFGGRSRRGKLVPPDPTIPVPCHLFDLSCALVPVCVFSSLHASSELFTRSFWDYGYGAKAAAAGIPRAVAPGIMARMESSPLVPVWKDPETPVWRRVLSYLDNLLRSALKRVRAVLF